MLVTETEHMSQPLSPTLCAMMRRSSPKRETWNQCGTIPRNFQGTDPEPLRINMDHIENVMMTRTDLQKKMKQPDVHASKLIVVQIPVPSLLLSRK